MSLAYILLVRGNSGDIDDTEYYVEHVVFAVLHESDQLFYYRSTPNHDSLLCTSCVMAEPLSKINILDRQVIAMF